MKNPPVVLTIAGSDNSCGAGAQADLKAITALGGYAQPAITCVVAEVPGRVGELAGRFGLAGVMNRLPDSLPLGLRQRLSLAVAGRVGFWGHPDPPGHLFQFSAATLLRLFSQNGLQPAALHHGGIPLRYSFGAPRDWLRSLKWALYCAAFMPIAAAAPWFSAGDDITLVGRRPTV
jgi:hypothetical protein